MKTALVRDGNETHPGAKTKLTSVWKECFLSSRRTTAVARAMEARPPADGDAGDLTSAPFSSARFLSATARAQMESQGASQVWAEVTALARLPGVLDLGQGWPDMGASEVARAAASEAMLSGHDPRSNQYSPPPGAPELVAAIDRYYRATGSLPDDSVQRDVLVTTSATEALYVTLQALCDPGDEVVFLEPFFPWYIAHARIFGATPRTVRLRADGDPGAAKTRDARFWLDLNDLRAAFVAGAGKTKAFIHCNPHNPTGVMFSEAETRAIAQLCAEFNVVIVADEVYERCTFDEQAPMTRIADVAANENGTETETETEIENVRARTLVVGSASKLLCLSGWRVGWVVGPKPLIAALRTMHGYATFCAPTPLQLGVAAALTKIADDADAETRRRAADASVLSPEEGRAFVENARRREAAFACTRGRLVPDAVAGIVASNVSVLSRALADSGVAPFAPSGGYFLVADVSNTGLAATEYCKALATGPARVAAVPMDVFFDEKKDSANDVPRNLVRFAVCKSSETIGKCAEAIRSNPIGAARK